MPDPEPASLRIVKVVDGDRPERWGVSFDVSELGGGSLGTVALDETDHAASAGELDEGTYTVTETVEDDSELTAVACTDIDGVDVIAGSDLGDRTATVVLDAGADVTCTFTNTYVTPRVLPGEEVPGGEVPAGDLPDEQGPTAVPRAAPTPQVEGDVITRTLPRTGDETRALAGVGAFLLALGAAMVLVSKRQLARD